MEIIAKTLTGRTVQLEAVELSQTVADIKRQIEAKEGTPADRQRLVFRGHTLEDERTLSHYELEADEPLVLVRRVVDLAGAPPTDDTEEQRKKLLRAAVLGQDDEVLRLLGRGVDVDSRDKWCADVAQRAAAEVNGTPLCNAASRGHAGTVSILLDADANPDLRSAQGGTPLHLAAGGGFAPIVALLLAAGARTKYPSYNGMTPLVAAAWHGFTDIVGLLLDAAERPPFPYSAVDIAAARGAGHPQDGETPLIAAASHAHAPTVRLLLERGADPNLADSAQATPLMHAATALGPGAAQSVALLLDAGADRAARNGDGETALARAAAHGRDEAARMLLDVSAAAPQVFEAATDQACLELNLPNEDGRTPLFLAARNGHVNAVRCLLDAGADPHLADQGEAKPIDAATDPEIRRMLRSASGCDVCALS